MCFTNECRFRRQPTPFLRAWDRHRVVLACTPVAGSYESYNYAKSFISHYKYSLEYYSKSSYLILLILLLMLNKNIILKITLFQKQNYGNM